MDREEVRISGVTFIDTDYFNISLRREGGEDINEGRGGTEPTRLRN